MTAIPKCTVGVERGDPFRIFGLQDWVNNPRMAIGFSELGLIRSELSRDGLGPLLIRAHDLPPCGWRRD